jgi:hypothetical protein
VSLWEPSAASRHFPRPNREHFLRLWLALSRGPMGANIPGTSIGKRELDRTDRREVEPQDLSLKNEMVILVHVHERIEFGMVV